ncbi:MAG: hypothetical protein J7513_14910 [Solirubrobacteraceae bacterium]|nr:hypothetical protein [Solirubrobacteraceae bacterium]
MKAEALDLAAHALATPPTRSGPDRCPTTTELHQAADGLIARLRVPGGRITTAQARVIAEVAAPGDSIELTSRANLQVRGLSAAAASRAVAAFAAAGLTPSPAHDRARTIVASPFAGPAVDEFIRALDAAIRALDETQAVSGRVLTVVDDGRGHALAAEADLLVVTQDGADDVRFAVGGLDAGEAPRAEAPQVGADLLGALATACTAAGVWRARELPARALAALARGTSEPFRAAVGTDTAGLAQSEHAGADASAAPAELPVGVVEQPGGRAAVRVLAPLGRLTAAQLTGAADLAERAGTDLRIDDRRGLTLADLPPATIATTTSRTDPGSIRAALLIFGFITDAADPALGLTACAGAACARTEVDVRAAARLRLVERRPGDGREHLVGCERRCGAPRDGLVVVAQPGDSPAQLAARAGTQSSPTGLEAAR